MHLKILANYNFAVGCGLFFLFGAAIYGMITMQPLFLQTLLGYTALDAGLTVSPRGLGALVSLFGVGLLIGRMGPKRLAAVGFILFSISCYLFSRMSLDVAMSNIVPANILNGLGTGLIFVPLSAVALGTLRQEEIGNAAGIQNLVRNIGGSVGISFVATMLDRLAQKHQNFMTERFSALSPIYQQRFATLNGALSARYGAEEAPARAQTVLSNLLHQQASYWAFIDLFFWFMLMGTGCAVAVWFLRHVRSAGPVAAH